MDKKGFTALEMMVVVGVILIIVMISIPYYLSFETKARSAQVGNEIHQSLRKQQTRAVNGENNASWGAYIQPHQYTLYKGTSYVARDTSYDEINDVDSDVTIANNFSDDIVFSKNTGFPSVTGTITITDDSGDSWQITINSQGMMDLD